MINLLKKITKFSIIILGTISVTIGIIYTIKTNERNNVTKKYEMNFLNFFNTGVLNECINPIMKNRYMDAKGLKELDLDISYPIKSYLEYVINIYNYDHENYKYSDNYIYKHNDTLSNYINNIKTYYNHYPIPNVDEYKYFYLTEEKNNICSKSIDTCFVRASLSELAYELNEEKLITILEAMIPHNSIDKYNGWILDGKKDLFTVLPGGIVIDFSGEVTIYKKNNNIKYNSIKILSPIYDINLLSDKKNYNDISIEINFIDEDGIERIMKSKAEQYSEKYVFNDTLKKIYNYDCPSSRKSFIMYSLGNIVKDTIRYDTYSKEMYKQNKNSKYPDLIHLACVGDLNSMFFIDEFKNKYKNNGLFKDFKVKNTRLIEVRNNLLEEGKELRELVLDDEKNTTILCLFKIIYIEEPNDHIKDILTYIIPEDKINLSYEEMYHLAFND